LDKSRYLIDKASILFTDLDGLKKQLDNPDAILARAFPSSFPNIESYSFNESITQKKDNADFLEITAYESANKNKKRYSSGDILDYDRALMAERRSLLDYGIKAISKIEAEGKNAKLTPIEENGLEAVILLIGRPAILIENGKFHPPPDEWNCLEGHRSGIERIIKSVGRIETPNYPLGFVGTGFMVSDDIVMTNKHVAETFCKQGQNSEWSFSIGSNPRIDFIEEFSPIMPSQLEFALTGLIGVHDSLDLALIKISNDSSSAKIPEPLSIALEMPDDIEDRKVYVVGYPARDNRNDSQEMKRIFWNIYNVKRLQPGLLRKHYRDYHVFSHDCSTLGGNSGSCVVDLESGQVVGLHFWGRYMDENKAIALWDCASDPLLKKAGINFN